MRIYEILKQKIWSHWRALKKATSPRCNFLLEFPEILSQNLMLSSTECVWEFKNKHWGYSLICPIRNSFCYLKHCSRRLRGRQSHTCYRWRQKVVERDSFYPGVCIVLASSLVHETLYLILLQLISIWKYVGQIYTGQSVCSWWAILTNHLWGWGWGVGGGVVSLYFASNRLVVQSRSIWYVISP